MLEPHAERAFSWRGRCDVRLADGGATLRLASPRCAPGLADALAARPGAGAATLTVGADAIPDDLPAAVAALAAAGHAPVALRADAAVLLDPARRSALVAAGLREVHLELQGPSAPVHEALTRRPGSFREAAQAVALCALAGLRVHVATTLTRLNFRHAAETAALAARAGASELTLELVRVPDLDAALLQALLPRLSVAAPYLARALDVMARAGKPARVVGVPPCFLPDHAAAARLDTPQAERGERCAPCRHASAAPPCAGVPRDYTAAFGWEEVVPLDAHGRPLDELALHAPPAPDAPRGVSPVRSLWEQRARERGQRDGILRERAVVLDAPVSDEDLAVARQLLDGDARRLHVCVWNPDGATIPRDALLRVLQAGRKAGAAKVRFELPDPVVHPDLLELLPWARLLRYANQIEVVSPGRHFAELAFANRVIEAGMSRLLLPLHGADASTHDRELGEGPCFEAAMEGVENLRRRAFTAIVPHFVATPTNLDAFVDVVALARARAFPELDPPRLSDPESVRPADLSAAVERERARGRHSRDILDHAAALALRAEPVWIASVSLSR